MEKTILVTGGAGSIGSIRPAMDCAGRNPSCESRSGFTYAGNPHNLSQVSSDSRYHFVHGDICDRDTVRGLLQHHQPRAIVHFAAESHVDRSIRGPDDFIHTNVNGTFCLLEAARAYFTGLTGSDRDHFRFLHISTDEVYGSLSDDAAPFCEKVRLTLPIVRYSLPPKAAADHLARAYHHTSMVCLC